MIEVLHSCPKCGRTNFTARGLKAHNCKPSPMPKPKSSSVEVVVAGQPSPKTLSLLKAAGAELTVERLSSAVACVERARADFIVRAVETGLLLLAKKQTFKHGEFQQFSAEVWTRTHMVDGQRLSIHGEALHNYTRSLRVYTLLAQHFIADLEQQSFQPEVRDQLVIAPQISTDDVVAMVEFRTSEMATDHVTKAIERFVSGRSLRRMLIDFRRAENASDVEEHEEQLEAEKRKRKKLPEQTPGQMDFLDDMWRPLREVEVLFNTPSFVRQTDQKFWVNLANKLEDQARKARELAKTITA